MAKKYLKKNHHSWKIGTCKSITFEVRVGQVALSIIAFSLDAPWALYVTDHVGMYIVIYYLMLL